MGSSSDLEEHQLLNRPQLSDRNSQSDDEDVASELELETLKDGKSSQHKLFSRLPTWTHTWSTRARRRRHGKSRSPFVHFLLPSVRRRRSIPLCAVQTLAFLSYSVVVLVVLFGLFAPSYSNPPLRYVTLRREIEQTDANGRGNTYNEKIFIAAAVYDHEGELLGGEWGVRLRQFVDILGPDNVFLSIYENDADDNAQLAMKAFAESVTCNKAIVHEHLDLDTLAHVNTPSGETRLKRIAFLAEVRNRALRPLDDPNSSAYNRRFDKVLYVNDVFFDPVEAANLLFSTNFDERSGKTNYRAACAVDFVNSFKFYDTFATRDTEGYRMGVPFFPWFTSSGNGTSRQDVLDQKDAVRVKSCWGGMVAFEAKWLQPRMHISKIDTPANETLSPALRFRSEPDTYWDSSECCLIHADLASLVDENEDPAIYMNPYVRVAYTPTVLRWLQFTRRFERLYPWVHTFVNRISARPGFNPRRAQQPGEEVLDRVWVWDPPSQRMLQTLGESGVQISQEVAATSNLNGSWQQVSRKATPGQFCGLQSLLYINEHPKVGEKPWAFADVP
jgi:hypothetical protein